MKSSKLRTALPLALLAVAGVAYVAHVGVGTASAVGWGDIAVLCPIGALGTMIASRTIVPRAVVSIVLAVAGIVLFGRAFCAWACPVPVWSKVRSLFGGGKKRASRSAVRVGTASESSQIASSRELVEEAASAVDSPQRATGSDIMAPLTAEERAALSCGCKGSKACGNTPSASRHFVLAGALLSTAVFGFPVFCLVCPVGLSFAGVFVLISLFTQGDVSWSVLAIPVVLMLEVVLFRKWCTHVCPISSFMSIVAHLNRTFAPSVDRDACLVESRGATCGRCADACPVGIDPRDAREGAALRECTKCRACVEACPAHALKMPLLPK